MHAIPGILLGLLMLAGLLVAHIAWCNERKARAPAVVTSAKVARTRLEPVIEQDRIRGPIGPRRAAWYLRHIAARPPVTIDCRCVLVPIDQSTEEESHGQ